MAEDEDIAVAALQDELLARKKGGWRRRMRFFAWRMSLRGAEALRRVVDIVVSVLALLLLSPLFLLLAIVIRLESRGSAIFAQARVGRHGRQFNFYKFRSMCEDAEMQKADLLSQNESADGVVFKMKNDPRITRFGRFLRRSSLDELPQFWNVLKGDMTLVGPRPPIPHEVSQYTLEDRKRLDVKPGLTCIWQISGRSDLPFKEQARLDLEYIRTRSLWTDLKILLKTPGAILSGKGAY